MGSGFKINKHGIEQMTREIQREFDRHPVSVPVRADAPELTRHETIHNGPVINIIGDRAQVSWGNDVSVQNQAGTDLVASGFEQIAQAIAATLNDLPSLGLPEVDLNQRRALRADVHLLPVRAPVDRRRQGRRPGHRADHRHAGDRVDHLQHPPFLAGQPLEALAVHDLRARHHRLPDRARRQGLQQHHRLSIIG